MDGNGDASFENLLSSDMTWEIMYKSSETPNKDHSYLMGTDACNTPDDCIALTMRSSGLAFSTVSTDGKYYYYTDFYEDCPILDGRWHHVAMVMKRTTKTVELYFDGIRIGEKTNWNPPGSIAKRGKIMLGPGSREYKGAFDHDARFARFVLWSRGLSADEVKSSASGVCPGNTDGMLALYNFDGSYYDSFGDLPKFTNVNGTFKEEIYNTASICQPPAHHKHLPGSTAVPKRSWSSESYGRLVMDGSGDPEFIDLFASLDITWEIMYKSSETPNKDHSYLMGTDACNTMDDCISLTMRNTGLAFTTVSMDGRYYKDFNVEASILDGHWHHIALVMKRSTQTVEIYFDGSRVGVMANWNPPGGIAKRSKIMLGPESREYKGAYDHDGRFARFVVWKRGLSADEVKASHLGTCPDRDGLLALYNFDGSYTDALGKMPSFSNSKGLFKAEIYPADLICLP